MKKVIWVAMATVVLCISGNVFAILSGGGTEASPYLIQSRADFDEFANPANASIYWASGVYTKLMCNLDLAGTTCSPALIAPDMSIGFGGIFDGNGHIISNLYVEVIGLDYSYIGLFGCIGPSGQVKNLGVESIGIYLAGFSDCVGGIAGINYGVLTACYVSSEVYAAGSFIGNANIGGLVGSNYGTLISCYALTNFLIEAQDLDYYMGGLVGSNYGVISFCYSTGIVAAPNQFTGGLVGWFGSGTIEACFWDTLTSYISDGIANVDPDPAGVMGKTTAEMMTLSTFTSAGWDFSTTDGGPAEWQMPTNHYPCLAWENIVATPTFSPDGGAYNSGRNITIACVTTGAIIHYTTNGLDPTESDPVILSGGSVAVSVNPATTLKARAFKISWNASAVKSATYVFHPYDGGTGTVEDPYQIASAAEFQQLSIRPSDWDKSFILTADIDLSGLAFTQSPIAPDTTNDPYWNFQGTQFTGMFDGNWHKISNLTINTSTKDYIGLFGYVGSGGEIKNLVIDDINVVGGNAHIGGVVGHLNYGTLTACSVKGSISGIHYVGGLIGSNYYGLLSSCHMDGLVMGINTILATSNSIGGLVGSNSGSIISCYATGSISGNNYLGGLVGANGGMLNSSYATAIVDGGQMAGGLAGSNSGSLRNCYAAGSVAAYNRVGGIVGDNYSGEAISCYATGSVTGKGVDSYKIGGLVGYNYNGTLTSCYATGLIRGDIHVGGVVGYNYSDNTLASCFWDTQTSGVIDGVGDLNPDPIGAIGKTTAEMMTFSTFTSADWDFSDTDGDAADWMMLRAGEDYPRLAWQEVYPEDIAGLYGINIVDYAEIAEHWGQTGCPTGCENADINHDGTVDILDLIALSENWLEGV